MDPAARFHAIYLAHCEACKLAGVAAPTPEQWVELVEDIRDAGGADGDAK